LSRYFECFALDGTGEFPRLQLASLAGDQFPEGDKARRFSREHGVPIFATPRAALTLGTDSLAVDAVFLIAEHGRYPESDTGQFIYPKRAMFEQVARVCEASGRSVPLFLDKHLADNWQDAKWIYDEARRLRMPLMAGSSLPVLWRDPAVDVERDAALAEILVLSYGRLDSYGFHACEIAQCLAERRLGGETGVRRVRALRGAAAWKACEDGRVDRDLLALAKKRFHKRPISPVKPLQEQVPDPALFMIEHADGLRVNILALPDLFIDWTAAWRYADGRREAAVFWTQEARPFSHFGLLLRHIESFMESGTPPWPVERTLLTTGILDAALVSRRDRGEVIETPHLNVAYRSAWNWAEPPPPAPDRPIQGQ
ncbi:MAG: hypothetical protein ACKOTB_04925, partial [Planctomycetia bacterium]